MNQTQGEFHQTHALPGPFALGVGSISQPVEEYSALEAGRNPLVRMGRDQREPSLNYGARRLPSCTMTTVPTGVISLKSFAANMGMRMQPWLAGVAGTKGFPWMAIPERM